MKLIKYSLILSQFLQQFTKFCETKYIIKCVGIIWQCVRKCLIKDSVSEIPCFVTTSCFINIITFLCREQRCTQYEFSGYISFCDHVSLCVSRSYQRFNQTIFFLKRFFFQLTKQMHECITISSVIVNPKVISNDKNLHYNALLVVNIGSHACGNILIFF